MTDEEIKQTYRRLFPRGAYILDESVVLFGRTLLEAAAKEAEINDGLTIAYMYGYEKGKDAGAAAEREACALECEDGASTPEELLCAKLIRARGQA